LLIFSNIICTLRVSEHQTDLQVKAVALANGVIVFLVITCYRKQEVIYHTNSEHRGLFTAFIDITLRLAFKQYMFYVTFLGVIS